MKEAAPAFLRQKKLAVAQHAKQAGDFARSYDGAAKGADVYTSCFRYSRKRLDTWLDRLLPDPGAGKRLLDVGCGTGHHMAHLRARGFEVAGVDGAEDMLRFARENNPGADLRQADVESLPHPDQSFDVVLSIEVLRYLPDAARAVSEMARVLRPGGVALVTATPRFNLNGYWAVNRLATALPLRGLVRLKQFFTTSSTLRRQFGAAGFDRTSVHGVYLGPVNWMERLAPSLLPSVLRGWEPLDVRLSDAPVLRDLSNMYLVHAVRAD